MMHPAFFFCELKHLHDWKMLHKVKVYPSEGRERSDFMRVWAGCFEYRRPK